MSGPLLDLPDVIQDIRRWVQALASQRLYQLRFYAGYTSPRARGCWARLCDIEECATEEARFDCGPCNANLESLIVEQRELFRQDQALMAIKAAEQIEPVTWD